MTREIVSAAVCPDCGVQIQMMTPFSQWLRKLPPPLDSANVDVENLDYIWFKYKEGWFITIEEKRFGARCTGAQRDTHTILAQLLASASGRKVQTWRGVRPIDYRGHFVIVFEKTTPDDSEWIEVNGERVAPQDIAKLLESGRL